MKSCGLVQYFKLSNRSQDGAILSNQSRKQKMRHLSTKSSIKKISTHTVWSRTYFRRPLNAHGKFCVFEAEGEVGSLSRVDPHVDVIFAGVLVESVRRNGQHICNGFEQCLLPKRRDKTTNTHSALSYLTTDDTG